VAPEIAELEINHVDAVLGDERLGFLEALEHW
jgi:hypothetical protein